MAEADTLLAMLRPLMDGCSVDLPWCAVCGATWPLNRHHIVRRGAGKLFRFGAEVPKPTITLCGSGNASGCHGLAHQNRLHFRWVPGETAGPGFGNLRRVEAGVGGHWEYLIADEPVDYLTALGMDGWTRLRGDDR